MELTGLSRRRARALLSRAEGAVKVAVVMHARDVSRGEARRRLARCGESLRAAMEGDS